MKAAIYARVSTVDQSCEMQLGELREYLTRRGWELADIPKPSNWEVHEFHARRLKDGRETNICDQCGNVVPHPMHTGRFGEYVDTGWSGAKASRPELNRLKRDAREHRFDCVLVWKLDRWGRSVSDSLASINDLRSHGIRWIAITQNLDTDQSNPMAELMLNIMAAFAQFEREMIRERTSAGMKAARHRGVKFGRRKAVFDRAKALEMRQSGVSIRDIATAFGVGASTVHRLIAA